MTLRNISANMNHAVIALHAGSSLLLVIVVYLLHSLVLNPMEQASQLNRDQALALTDMSSHYETTELRYQKLCQELETVTEKLEQMNARLDSKTPFATVLSALGKLEDEAGIQIQDLRPGTVEQRGEFQANTVHLGLKGEFAAVCNFLAGLDNVGRLNRVRSLQINPESRDQDTCRVTLILEFYSMRPDVIANSKGSMTHAQN